jgi:transposase
MLSIPNNLESSVSRTGGITMQELERAEIIKACSNGEIKATVAAKRLQITTRQVRRLLTRFAEGGTNSMISGRRGRRSNNQLAPGLAQQALQLVRDHYADFGPTLACEHLVERHGVELSKETLRKLMIEAGLWSPRSARQPLLHQPRERRACLGELVQIDGSRHHWFEQRGDACALLAYVDDATGRLLQLHFAETESTDSYFEATRRYIEQHGKPLAFYADRAAVFRAPAANRHIPTQFQRALDELGIELICANSPQAKGRVERANRTLQDRLVKALRIEGIDDIEAANAWCDQFMQRYNARFACAPRSPLDAHAAIRTGDDLARILALRDTRKLTSKLTLQHRRWLYLLRDQPGLRALIGQTIAIHTYADGRVELRANDQVLPHTRLKQPRAAGPIEVNSKTVHHVVDKQARNRDYRQNQPATVIAQGVRAAKKMSAQKRA